METLKFRIQGKTDLIMHNIRLANPLDPFVQKISLITSKKAKEKTTQDLIDLQWLEFQGGLYLDEKMGPYIPGRLMVAVIREAAKRQRKGKSIQRSLSVCEDKIKLEYDGPRDSKRLWEVLAKDGTQPFVDVRGMKPTGRGVVQRCRPVFHQPWGAEFSVEFDENELNARDIVEFVRTAGSVTGMMDDRPNKGGRFDMEVVD